MTASYRTRHLLLVEDNADDEVLTLRALAKSQINAQVVVARDGLAAIDYLTSTDALPELVLLDLQLPKLSGVDVLRRLRANPSTRRLPVIILTSSKEPRDLCETYDSGANSYVQKPAEFAAFLSAMKQVGSYWLQLNEAPPIPD